MVAPVAIVNKKDVVMQQRLKNQLKIQESRLDKLMSLQDKMKQEIMKSQDTNTDLHLSAFERMIIEEHNQKEDAAVSAIDTSSKVTALFQGSHGLIESALHS